MSQTELHDRSLLTKPPICLGREVVSVASLVRGLVASDGDSSNGAVTDGKAHMMDMPHRISHVVSYK
jgi:hypothetical protein